MDTGLQDAESRLSRLMADFYETVDRLNMEDMVQAEPKKVVGYLVEALRPPAFKASVKDQLGRQSHKTTKSNIKLFLKRVRGELEGFMRFEAHIASASQGKGAAKSDQEQKPTEKSLNGRGWQNIGGKTRQQPVKHSEQQKKIQKTTANSGKSDKKCFKCEDLAHGVFQCPNISSPAEAKELYEKCTGKRVMKPVLAAIPTDQAVTTASPAIPCVVMSTVETSITLDSAAEVSVVTTKLLKQLSASGAWIVQQVLTGTAGVTGIGDKSVPVKSKVKLDLRFSTPGGPLILQNVICWVTDQPLPPGVGDLLLSRWIMVRLGYSSDKSLAAAQQVQSVWDMCDVNEETTSGMASVLAYSGQMTHIEPADEELDLQEDEDQSCFPTFTDDAETERELIRSILLEKVEEARLWGRHPSLCRTSGHLDGAY
ncbi:hypothetical protein PI124_g14111 [Phytophthora idaei]|nr:hypothetical protein PI124_g14111 [Phytophthora idaei]